MEIVIGIAELCAIDNKALKHYDDFNPLEYVRQVAFSM
jgi:hypothetical protein